MHGLLYLAELPDASVGGLPSMLAIDGVLLEEQVEFVVLRIVALGNEVNGHEPGVCKHQEPPQPYVTLYCTFGTQRTKFVQT